LVIAATEVTVSNKQVNTTERTTNFLAIFPPSATKRP
jgi:hypothetical protein